MFFEFKPLPTKSNSKSLNPSEIHKNIYLYYTWESLRNHQHQTFSSDSFHEIHSFLFALLWKINQFFCI